MTLITPPQRKPPSAATRDVADQGHRTLIWVEAPDFQLLGGWVWDTQFVHLTGARWWVAQGDLAAGDAAAQPSDPVWCRFPLMALTARGYSWVWLEPAAGVDWWHMTNEPLDVWGAHSPDGGASWQAKNNTSYALLTASPDFTPLDYSASHVINGIGRMTGQAANQWASDPEQPLPQWLELTWPTPVSFNRVHLTFDTDMNRPPMAYSSVPAGVPQCVKDYTVEAEVDGSLVPVVEVQDNFLRKRVHRIPALTTRRLRVVVRATHGDASARIFEVRIYDET